MAVGRELLQFVSHAHPLPEAQENSPQSSLLRRWGSGEKRWKVLNKKLFLLARGWDNRQKLLLGEGGRGFQKPQRGAQSPSHDISCFLGTFPGFLQLDEPWGAGRAVCFAWSCGNSAFGVPIPGPLLVTCLVLSKCSSASQGLGFLTCKLGGLTRGPEIPSRSSVTP